MHFSTKLLLAVLAALALGAAGWYAADKRRAMRHRQRRLAREEREREEYEEQVAAQATGTEGSGETPERVEAEVVEGGVEVHDGAE